MIVSADDVRYSHVRVVHDHAEVVDRRAVGPRDHKVVDLGRVEVNFALDHVLNDDIALVRRAEPDGERRARPGRAVAAGARIARFLALGNRGLPVLLKFLSRARAGIGESSGDKRVAVLGVDVGSLRLEERALVPREPQPLHAIEDAPDALLGRALLVSVLDPEDERAAGLPGQEPVVERGPRPADMKVAGGARREPGANFGH